jgi:hypothetical protein
MRETFLAEIAMTSKNGVSLMIAFKGTIHGHRNYMPVTYASAPFGAHTTRRDHFELGPFPKHASLIPLLDTSAAGRNY